MQMALQQSWFAHVDMDAFYASVEVLDYPELAGLPLAVGGPAEGRGVVAAASYEARRFGVRSAMPTAEALRRCPQLVLRKGRMGRYREKSQEVLAILAEASPRMETISLDEAFHGAKKRIELDSFEPGSNGQAERRRRNFEVTIPAGVVNGSRIRLAAQGCQGVQGGAEIGFGGRGKPVGDVDEGR